MACDKKNRRVWIAVTFMRVTLSLNYTGKILFCVFPINKNIATGIKNYPTGKEDG